MDVPLQIKKYCLYALLNYKRETFTSRNFIKKKCHVTALRSGKIWKLIHDWSRLKSSEPKAGDNTRKMGPLYFTRAQEQ